MRCDRCGDHRIDKVTIQGRIWFICEGCGYGIRKDDYDERMEWM